MLSKKRKLSTSLESPPSQAKKQPNKVQVVKDFSMPAPINRGKKRPIKQKVTGTSKRGVGIEDEAIEERIKQLLRNTPGDISRSGKHEFVEKLTADNLSGKERLAYQQKRLTALGLREAPKGNKARHEILNLKKKEEEKARKEAEQRGQTYKRKKDQSKRERGLTVNVGKYSGGVLKLNPHEIPS